MGRLLDVPSLSTVADIRRGATTRHGRVNLHDRRKDLIAKRERRAPGAGLARWLLDAFAQRLQQQRDARLLGRLCLVVGSPVLGICLALNRRFDLDVLNAICRLTPRNPEPRSLLVLASETAQFVVGAGTGTLGEIDDVGWSAPTRCLARHHELGADLADATISGDLASTLFPSCRQGFVIPGLFVLLESGYHDGLPFSE